LRGEGRRGSRLLCEWWRRNARGEEKIWPRRKTFLADLLRSLFDDVRKPSVKFFVIIYVISPPAALFWNTTVV
jgi:hypothetical protein